MNALVFITWPSTVPVSACKLLSSTKLLVQQDMFLHTNCISSEEVYNIQHTTQQESLLALMCHLVQVLEQPEVCGEEDVCSTFGNQVSVMISGVPIHL